MDFDVVTSAGEVRLSIFVNLIPNSFPNFATVCCRAGANRRWRGQFRCRGSRRESAVAQLTYIATFGPVKPLIGRLRVPTDTGSKTFNETFNDFFNNRVESG